MSIDPVYWRNNWLISLLSLSDIDLQRERWLNKEIRNPHWSYVEFMCTYFDDTLYGQDYEFVLRDGLVREREYECIKNFHDALKKYKTPNDDDYDVMAILNDNKWQEITALGKASLERLKNLLISEEEKEIFIKRLHAPPLTSGDFTWGID